MSVTETNLALTGQVVARDQIAPKLLALKSEMDKRAEIWGKLTDKQKRWVIVNDKDVIMTLAWDVYKYLKPWFEQAEGA